MAKKDMEWLRLAGIGPHLVIATVIGWCVGHFWIDKWLGTDPVFSVIFSLLGVAAGFINLFREVALINQQEEEGPDEPDETD